MVTKLMQEKLDVKDKTKSNIFNWRGQFTPEFVEYILDSYAKPGDIVIDPFSGSGTVLLESAIKGLSCYGFDINPSAYLMSSFFIFCNMNINERELLISSIESKIMRLMPPPDIPLKTKSNDYRENYIHLIEFCSSMLGEINDDYEKIILANILFIAEKSSQKQLNAAIVNSFNYIKDTLISLPYTDKEVKAYLADAKEIYKYAPLANIIFTSPPYINVFNYHQNYRALVETLGWDILKIARSEFGSNRKNRENRFKTVVQYCLDMEQTIKGFWKSLQPGGIIIMVVGRESNVRGIPFYNGKMVKDIFDNIGGFENVTNYERAFLNKFGTNIKEDIIVYKKCDDEPTTDIVSKDIVLNHIKNALLLADDEVKKSELNKVIDKIDTIEPSPIFSSKGD